MFWRTFLIPGLLSLLFSPQPCPAGERTVVLRNGNVLEGDVSRQETQIVIRTATSELRLPWHEVELVSRDLHTAYLTKSRRARYADPAVRAKLIGWCLKVGLRTEAQRELQSLRQEVPDLERLELLERQVRSDRSTSRQTILPSAAPLPADRQFAAERLDRLSKPTVSEFTRRVQPLLLHRCGLAGCHGKGTSTGYTLIGSLGSKPAAGTTQRNLGATLRRIDITAPRQSLLWMSANSSHGGSSKKPMGEQDLDMLAGWMDRVTRELAAGEPFMNRESLQARQDEGPDPFDPAEFNAQANSTADAIND